MTDIIFTPIPTSVAQNWWEGGPDEHGNPLETRISDGGAPCRHCLKNIKEGKLVLLGAYKPFSSTGHFAETGPIFICSDPCERFAGEKNIVPPAVAGRETFIIRGYSADEKIDYRTGQIVNVLDLQNTAEQIFAHKDVAFIHLRSAAYTCFTTRIDRSN